MICAHYPGVMNLTDDNHSLHKKATKECSEHHPFQDVMV